MVTEPPPLWKAKPCGPCGGRGTVPAPRPVGEGLDPIACPHCNGSGFEPPEPDDLVGRRHPPDDDD